ncbi:MAG: patatin-like phospholipase family protein [Acidobacteria bacterium]|nr:patatin-like phospholipase family protein [Acidobacteriota bacterium]
MLKRRQASALSDLTRTARLDHDEEKLFGFFRAFRGYLMKVGLALSGGGARGFAHVGVLKALVGSGIPIDVIAGTSAGSIVGGAFAAGMSVDEIVAMSRRVGWLNFTRPSFSPLAFLSNAPMGTFLRRELPVTRFEDLKLPFAAVAYDLTENKERVFRDRGDLVLAIRASCAVPGVFAPVRDEAGHILVDGGVSTVLPVHAVKELGADIVIAVDLLSSGEEFRSQPRSAFTVIMRSTMALLRHTASEQRSTADLVIEPQIAHIRPDQIKKREELLRLGEEAAREKIPEIKALINRGG